jgi:GT2 family glycosyltransferase
MNDIPNVGTVIVTYNRLELLKRTLSAVFDQDYPRNTVFVVDNGSTDGTEKYLQTLSDITYIRQPNIGGAGGFYRGIKECFERGYDWIWCMDDDVMPVSSALAELVKAVDRYPDAVCLVPRRIYEDGTEIGGHEQIVDYDWYSVQSFRTPNSLIDVPLSKFTFEGPMVSADAVRRIGFPDPKYFILYDDVDYAYRLSQVGSCYYISSSVMVKMIRILSALFVPGNEWKQYFRWRNYVFFMKKSLGSRALVKIMYRLTVDSRAIVKTSIRQHSIRPLCYFRVLSCALWDAVAGSMGNRKYFWMK